MTEMSENKPPTNELFKCLVPNQASKEIRVAQAKAIDTD